MATPSLRIGSIHSDNADGRSRVWTEIDDEPLWFSTKDAVLRPAAEGFATALLPAATTSGRRLLVENEVCPEWANQMSQVVDLFQQWWGGPRINVDCRRLEGADLAGRSPSSGLCFSGGVDSFFSLLRRQPRVQTLVYVYDYDIPIRGHDRQPHFESWFRQLCERADVRGIVLRTNLKTHAAYGNVDWIAAHGAGLAAAGHLLSDEIGTLVLSSSYSRADSHPCGTHWQLDHLWSSTRLRCEHFGDTHRRSEKLVDIAGDPLVRDFLRVCWSNREDRQNCGECEKCVRTQLVLLAAGQLSEFPVFQHPATLAERIDRLRKIYLLDLTTTYRRLLQSGLPLSVEQAVSRLIARTERSFRWKRIKRACRDRCTKVLSRKPALGRELTAT